MPRGDRTGPQGMGPKSGRAAGFCAGSGTPGYAQPGPDYGPWMGGGRGGGGRGWRRMFHATGLPGWRRFGGAAAPYYPAAPFPAAAPDAEQQSLKRQADYLQTQLEGIRRRLEELEASPPEA